VITENISRLKSDMGVVHVMDRYGCGYREGEFCVSLPLVSSSSEFCYPLFLFKLFISLFVVFAYAYAYAASASF
jgi:hypothetical protein